MHAVVKSNRRKIKAAKGMDRLGCLKRKKTAGRDLKTEFDLAA
jgi:hypothetical protein